MLYSLSTACRSKYCTCISRKRPVSARIRVQWRPVPVWNLPPWALCAKLSSDCPFLCFHFFQGSLQLVPARCLHFVLYLIRHDLPVKIYRAPGYPEQPNQEKLPQVWQKRFKMNLVHMKSLQAQTKNKTQKSLSNHLRHN